MSIFAKRYQWQEVHPNDNTALLDEFVAHPEFLSHPLPPDQARAVGAHLLTDPGNIIWATYSKDTLTGVVVLTRVIPKVDALLHFLFLDRDLSSKRQLLKNLLRHCLTDLGFHRLSMEVPEGIRLERFARRTLGFRLEGEIRDRPPQLSHALDNVWMAKQGSRREQGYFDGTTWSDILLLRLLAGEVGGDETEVPCQYQQSSEPQPPSSAEPSDPRSAEEVPKTPSPSSPRTSKDSADRT